MFKSLRLAALASVAAISFASVTGSAQAAAPACASWDHVSLAISIYTGWQPWYWANVTGVLKEAFEKNCIHIDVQEMDYPPSIAAYAAKQVDAVVITNFDALVSPIAGGVDSTVVTVGDFSNGNDAVVSRKAKTVVGLKGLDVYRAENSVTDYLIERALEQNGMKATQLKLHDLSDGAHQSAFETGKADTVGTWNPMTYALQQIPGTHTVFDSSKIPGEIQDLLIVRTDKLKSNEKIGYIFNDVWYQAMKLMQSSGKAHDDAVGVMAAEAKSSLADFNAQLKTTAMFYTPADAVAFTSGKTKFGGHTIVQAMDFVRKFSFDRGLMAGTTSVDDIGISFSNGAVLGNNSNVLFRFETKYMEHDASGNAR